MGARINGEAWNTLTNSAGQWIKKLKAVHRVIKQINPHRQLIVFRWEHIDGIASNSEGSP